MFTAGPATSCHNVVQMYNENHSYIYTTQIYDGAANMWRTVIISGISVRWIDLGTRLILRHVVRVLGAEEGEQNGNNNNNNEAQGEGGGNNQEESNQNSGGIGRGVAGDRNGRANSDSDREARGGLATAEVDLDEVRWAECTVRGKQRKPSRSTAKKLAGTSNFHTSRISKDVWCMRIPTLLALYRSSSAGSPRSTPPASLLDPLTTSLGSYLILMKALDDGFISRSGFWGKCFCLPSYIQ